MDRTSPWAVSREPRSALPGAQPWRRFSKRRPLVSTAMPMSIRLISRRSPACALYQALSDGSALQAAANGPDNAHRDVLLRGPIADIGLLGDASAHHLLLMGGCHRVRHGAAHTAKRFERARIRLHPCRGAFYIRAADRAIGAGGNDGLIVPVLRDAGSRSPADLRKGLDRLRADTASRTVPPEELKGATFTLSNFGKFGGRFAPLVVVPPQVPILGAGRAGERAVARNGAPAARRVLPLSLTFDHRAVTGGEAARFLAALKADLERAQ
jgi:2-oxoacid dehydrogenases acyltransferase (catalytic domain)